MAPPLNATSSAGAMPPVAACAVRTLAFTETFIPIKPQAPDNTAPIIKPNAVFWPKNSPIKMASITPTMVMALY